MLRRALAQAVDCSTQRLGLSTAAGSLASSSTVSDIALPHHGQQTAASDAKRIKQLDFGSLCRLVKEFSQNAPQRQFKFVQLFTKASSAEEAQEALSLLEMDRRQRSRVGMNAAYRPEVSSLLLEMLYTHGNMDSLVSTIEQAHVLGLGCPKRPLANVLRRLSSAGDLRSMEKVFLVSLLTLDRPSKDMLFVLMKAFSEAGEHAKVLEYAAEAERLHIQLSPAMSGIVEAARKAAGEAVAP